MITEAKKKTDRLTYPIIPTTTFSEAREIIRRLLRCGWSSRLGFDDDVALLVIEFPSRDFGNVMSVMSAIGVRCTAAGKFELLVSDCPHYEQGVE